MCLAIPGKVISVSGTDPLYRFGEIDFNGARKSVGLGLVPEVEPGQFVLVHVGVALQIIDESEAAEIWKYLEEFGETIEEVEPDPSQPEIPEPRL